MPYASKKQRGYLHAHPEITDKKGRPVAQKWDAEIHAAKRKGRIEKRGSDWGKAIVAGTAAGALANQFPRVQDINRSRRRKKKGKVEKMLVPASSNPNFNQAAAQKAFDLVMKMDDDTAEMFTFIVASDIFEETIEKNLEGLQRVLNKHFAQRAEVLKKALVRGALNAPKEQLEEYAKAFTMLEEISKAPGRTPQYYGYTWNESDFRRDPGTGRFMVKVHHTMEKPLKNKDQAKKVIGSYGPKDLDDKQRARYQDEYRQVASFLSAVGGIQGDTGNVDVVYHLRDSAGNVFSAVNNEGKPPSNILDDPDTTLIALEAKPTTLSVGGAAYSLAGAMGNQLTGEQVARANLAAEQFPAATMNWAEAGEEKYQTSQAFNRLQSTGNFMNQVGAPGSKVQLAGKFAEIVGEFGPEAERVLGPSARKTAYRYRGTEKAPDKQLISAYGREIQQVKRYGLKEEEAEPVGFGTQRQPQRGDMIAQGRRVTGAKERRLPAGEGRAVGQIAQGEAALAAREPTWAERGQGSALVARYLEQKLPDKHLYRLHLAAGNTPPSEGVIINSQGQLAVQAVGYGDDHYLPFNLKNLKALKGGEYIRNRSVGGLTSEDIYTGLISGARRVTVVSRSGTFTMEFHEDFRGGRRHNDKARRMTRRYENLLDAVQSGQVDRQQVPKRWRDAIEQEVKDEYGDVPRSVIRDERDHRIKEFKENPDIEGRDLDTAETMITDFSARATEAEAKQFRREVMNELHNMKEVRFRLNGIGYEAALTSLKEQFPYYIKSGESRVTRDEELLEFEMDEGYVEPGRNRPTKARANLYGTKDNPGTGFISASQVDYQRGRTGKGGFKAPAQRAAELPAPTGAEGEPESRTPATGDARKAEIQRLQDAYNMESKTRSAKRSARELRKIAQEGRPDFQGEQPPMWWTMTDPQFDEWFAKPENADEFHTYMARSAPVWTQPGSQGLPGFGVAWVNYEASRGAANQIKFQMSNAAHFPAIPYSFVDDKNDAYHAGTRPGLIIAAISEIDRKEVNFTTKKQMSAMTDAEMEEELSKTQYLRAQAQGAAVNDILAVHAQNTPGAPPIDRMKVILSSDKVMDQHLENIHRVRYLKEMQKVAKNPPAKLKPVEGEGESTGGAGPTGGQPSTPTQPRPTVEPGTKATTTQITVDARRERVDGAAKAVEKLKAMSQDKSLNQAQRNKAFGDMRAIASFGVFLQKHPQLTDPIEIDKEMDGKLDDNQKQYVAGLF
jgi:hypothetical protein